MKFPIRAIRRRQTGAATIELAAFLLIAISILTVPLFISIYFWHYSAVQKAAQGAAEFLSRATTQEMKSYGTVDSALQISRLIADDGTSDLLRSNQYHVQFACNMSASSLNQWEDCGGGKPYQVRVIVSLRLFDIFFGDFDAGDAGVLVRAEAVAPYIGI